MFVEKSHVIRNTASSNGTMATIQKRTLRLMCSYLLYPSFCLASFVVHSSGVDGVSVVMALY